MAFALETSGTVHAVPGGPAKQGTHHPVDLDWCDLSPFARGYIEAFLRSAGADRFDVLAPETLARIIADCGAFSAYLKALYSPLRYGRTSTDGRSFWASRQRGERENFPPLTVRLGDDGKVRFAEDQKEA